jgi:hypothetical protein
MLQEFIQNVLSVYRRMLQSVLSVCCICLTRILQQYVSNISVISYVAARSFPIASYKYFIGALATPFSF